MIRRLLCHVFGHKWGIGWCDRCGRKMYFPYDKGYNDVTQFAAPGAKTK